MCFSIRQIDPHRPKPGLARRRIRLFSHAQIVQKKDPDTFDPRRILPLTARFVISLMRSKRRGKKKQDRFGKAPFAAACLPRTRTHQSSATLSAISSHNRILDSRHFAAVTKAPARLLVSVPQKEPTIANAAGPCSSPSSSICRLR